MDFGTIFTGVLTQELNNRPHSNFARIVFPFKSRENKFEKFEFNSIMTEGKLTEEDVDRVLKSLEKSKDFKPSIPKWLTILIVALLFVLFILIIIIVAQFERSMENSTPEVDKEGKLVEKKKVDYKFVLVAGLIGINNLVIILLLLFANCLYKKSLDRREKDIKRFLSDFNANEFSSKGIEWRSGTFGAWISVELNYVLRQRNAGFRKSAQVGGGKKVEELNFEYEDDDVDTEKMDRL